MSDILQKLLEQDENEKLDFKEKLPLEKTLQRKELAKDVCCFANSQGGYLIIGVEDETKTRVGIPPGSLNIEMILRVARDRITPPVLSIEAWEESYEGLVFGIVKVEKTHFVHQTNGVHYIRVNQDCIQADTSIIAKMDIESKKYWIEENRRLEEEAIKNFMKIESAEVDTILKRCVKERFKDGFLERFSFSHREKNWLRRNLLENRMNAFKDACSITIDSEDSEINENLTALLSIRGVGLLAMAHSLYSSNREDRKIRIVFEYNPEINERREDDYDERLFFEWLGEFSNYEEEEGDATLLKQNLASSDPSILLNMDKAVRLLNLKGMQIKMLEAENEILKETPSISLLFWLYMTALSIDSTWQLAKGKPSYVSMLEKDARKSK